MEWLSRKDWGLRAAAHRDRLLPYVEPHLERRRRGVRHPVFDFLFSYYSQRPAQLLQWHPGYGVALAGADRSDWKGYAGSSVSPDQLTTQLPLVRSIRALMAATASRPANLGCFGLHEWAMVYRLEPGDVRHASWPLRLSAEGTDQVVESHRIACSHFDAFRFFTPQAAPLNLLRPGRDDRPDFEQPGCLHAGMDLYKHAFRLTPLIPSELVADCFVLARDIRALDMRASPYDFTGLVLEPGPQEWTPVRIETVEGKAEYVAGQREFSERAAPLRQHLVDECDRLLSA